MQKSISLWISFAFPSRIACVCFKTMFRWSLWLRKYWFRFSFEGQRLELCFCLPKCKILVFEACRRRGSSYMQILFMIFILIFNHVRFRSRKFWQLMTFDICASLRLKNILCGFLFTELNFLLEHTHALLCGSKRNEILSHAGNWLRKVNIAKDVQISFASPQQFSPSSTGQTVLSSIKKKLFFAKAEHVKEWWFTKYYKLCFMPSLSSWSSKRKKSVTSQ